jgi:outer membrane protein OmpA-like peptidoglycan-associated protein
MRKFALVALLSTSTFVVGCATKNYVRETVAPVQTKVDQAADTNNKQDTEIVQDQKDIQKNTTDISATREIATGADTRAGDAINRANTAQAKANQDAQDVSSLKTVVANLDDYKVTNTVTVLFPFNSAKLSKDDMAQLDMLVGGTTSLKHYFVAIEGYTDKTGSADYNLALSERRANSVMHYLAAEKDVDFNRIHTIGFGQLKPADPGNKRDDRAKNRRVEVKIYSADASYAAAAK